MQSPGADTRTADCVDAVVADTVIAAALNDEEDDVDDVDNDADVVDDDAQLLLSFWILPLPT